MQTFFFVVYDVADGTIRWQGSDLQGADFQNRNLPPYLAAIDVPYAALLGSDGIDLALVRDQLVAKVNAGADDACKPFLTPGETQQLRYQGKLDEARRWTADNAIETPFLGPEAAARNMTVAALAAEVIATADAWAKIGGAVEAARMGAKDAIAVASNLPQLVAAAIVDWGSIIAAATAPPATPAPSAQPATPSS